MTNKRAKIAAGATVLGLGALGGVALGTNHSLPAATQGAATQGVVAGRSSAPIVTSASGTASATASQPIAVGTSSSTRPPIVTRASGAGGRVNGFDD
jgi:hypothetical protein